MGEQGGENGGVERVAGDKQGSGFEEAQGGYWEQEREWDREENDFRGALDSIHLFVLIMVNYFKMQYMYTYRTISFPTHTFVLYLSQVELKLPLSCLPCLALGFLPSLDFLHMLMVLVRSLNDPLSCSWHERANQSRNCKMVDELQRVLLSISSVVRRGAWSCLQSHVASCSCVKTVADTSKKDPTLNKYTMIHSWR